jgi:hypothetical protein
MTHKSTKVGVKKGASIGRLKGKKECEEVRKISVTGNIERNVASIMEVVIACLYRNRKVKCLLRMVVNDLFALREAWIGRKRPHYPPYRLTDDQMEIWRLLQPVESKPFATKELFRDLHVCSNDENFYQFIHRGIQHYPAEALPKGFFHKTSTLTVLYSLTRIKTKSTSVSNMQRRFGKSVR